MWTDDPARDADGYWARKDREQEEYLKRFPECSCCGEPITEKKAVHIAGAWYCEECENNNLSTIWTEYIREEFLENTER